MDVEIVAIVQIKAILEAIVEQKIKFIFCNVWNISKL